MTSFTSIKQLRFNTTVTSRGSTIKNLQVTSKKTHRSTHIISTRVQYIFQENRKPTKTNKDSMAVIAPPAQHGTHQLRNSQQPPQVGGGIVATFRRLLFLLTFSWPLFALAYFAFVSQPVEQQDLSSVLLDSNNELNQELRFNVRSLLDRVDVMGYGPTHPRIGVVVVGDESNSKLLGTVESLFRYV